MVYDDSTGFIKSRVQKLSVDLPSNGGLFMGEKSRSPVWHDAMIKENRRNMQHRVFDEGIVLVRSGYISVLTNEEMISSCRSRQLGHISMEKTSQGSRNETYLYLAIFLEASIDSGTAVGEPDCLAIVIIKFRPAELVPSIIVQATFAGASIQFCAMEKQMKPGGRELDIMDISAPTIWAFKTSKLWRLYKWLELNILRACGGFRKTLSLACSAIS